MKTLDDCRDEALDLCLAIYRENRYDEISDYFMRKMWEIGEEAVSIVDQMVINKSEVIDYEVPKN